MQTLLSIPQVAKLLQVSNQTCYTLAERGELPIIRVGKQIRVAEDELEAWMRANTQRPARIVPLRARA